MTSLPSSQVGVVRSRPTEGLGSGAFLLTFGVLGFVAAAPLTGWWAAFDDGYQRTLSATFVATCAFGAALGIYRGLRPVILLASVFAYCWLAVPSAYQISHGVAAWNDSFVTLQKGPTSTALVILCVSQASMTLSYALVSIRRKSVPREGTFVPPSARRTLTLSTVALLAATLLLPLVVQAVGGFSALYTSRDYVNDVLNASGIASDQGTKALVRIVPGALATLGCLLALTGRRAEGYWTVAQLRRARINIVWAVCLLALYANPFAYTRLTFLICFGSVVLFAIRPTGRIAAWAVAALGVCAFLLVYPALNYFRAGVGSTRPTSETVFSTIDFDGFQQVINTVTLVQARGLADGIHLLSGFFFYVPRGVWHGKAFPASFEVAANRGYAFQNLSLPFPAEVYLDLGWFGLVPLMAGLGWCWAKLDASWVVGGKWMPAAAFMATAQIGLMRGPFGSLVPVYGFTMALLVAVIATSRTSGERE